MRQLRLAWVCACLLAVGCTGQTAANSGGTATGSGSPLNGRVNVPPSTLQQDDAQWVMPAKNYASTRYSGLNEINTGNVNRLHVAWTFSTGVNAGHEAAPLVVGSTMYLVTPFPNLVFALDLAKPGAPVKWQYDPKPAAAASRTHSFTTLSG